MADNIGVLGLLTTGILSPNTYTVYVCPAGKAAKVRLMALFQGNATSDVGILVNEIEVARTGAIGANNYVYTNGGAGLLTAPGAAKPTGQTAAATVQPAPPIYYLSAGQAIRYSVNTANLISANVQVVGVELDLIP